ncbi:hypothetical protein [Pseudidiomarina donghaiensis]|uniref:Uncharacterized protein n=1 Tax=Pseudidiomarina donghaiensis TaxID=519452 RepID=A0A432XDC2_9GAMM|nr:hypothetical protein [Pseudidiomarina donghaiensis]RUO46738.1 hypothetical protein CWE24_10870 [Pseudidiomarina donghaiensis]SFV24511.1 hypothetical protein SAMN04488139_2314 [Pseudidiomarina donghaiensis]
MINDHEKALQHRWNNHVEQQVDSIELTWQQVQPNDNPRRVWKFATAAAIVVAVSYIGWHFHAQPNAGPSTGSDAPMLLASNYTLAALDERIQLALLHGADEATLEYLWQQRALLTQ